jgi:hypothetical protein
MNQHKPDLPYAHEVSTDQGTVFDYWWVQPSEDWSTDCATGRDYARACLAEMAEREDPTILSRTVSAMVAKGSFGGIETGFTSFIASRCLGC